MSDNSPNSWKATLPCSQAQAEAASLADLEALGWPDPPVLVASEIDEREPDAWAVHAYFENEPTPEQLAQLARFIGGDGVPSMALQSVPDEDWITLSQAGLEPITAGRFRVHTPHMPASTAPGIRNFCIEAGLAFGTGHHETTFGCLALLDKMQADGVVAHNMIDIGTGTGLLAFAAMHLWPDAQFTASDIDPVCGPVVEENAAINDIGTLPMFIADGLYHPALQDRGPYDLIAANILAGPLIELAADIGGALTSGGNLLLAGLLTTQADKVLAAYAAQDIRPVEAMERGDWTILWLRKA